MAVDGYDFPEYIRAVNSGALTRNNCREAARLLIQGYVRKNEDLEKSTVLFFIDLERIGALKVLLNNLCVHIRENYSTIYPVIDNLLKDEVINFLDDQYVDAVLLFDAIKRNLQSAAFEEVYNPLTNFLLQDLAIEGHIGSSCPAADFHGFSTYLPRLAHHDIAELFCWQYFYGLGDSRFVNETIWDDLVVNFTRWRPN
jgi:hypothetical protein